MIRITPLVFFSLLANKLPKDDDPIFKSDMKTWMDQMLKTVDEGIAKMVNGATDKLTMHGVVNQSLLQIWTSLPASSLSDL